MSDSEETHPHAEEQPVCDLAAVLEAKKQHASEDALAMEEAAKMLREEIDKENAEIQRLKEKQVC